MPVISSDLTTKSMPCSEISSVTLTRCDTRQVIPRPLRRRKESTKAVGPKQIIKQLTVLVSFMLSCFLIDQVVTLAFQSDDPFQESNLRGGEPQHQMLPNEKQLLMSLPLSQIARQFDDSELSKNPTHSTSFLKHRIAASSGKTQSDSDKHGGKAVTISTQLQEQTNSVSTIESHSIQQPVIDSSSSVPSHNSALQVGWNRPQYEHPIPHYNYLDIEKSASIFESYYARVLMFDGEDFSWWSMLSKNVTSPNSAGGERSIQSVPMLVHALKENFPERFAKGQPPFQLMTSDGDAINFGACTSNPHKCNMNEMPPLLAHGSVPTRENDYRFIKAYPNWNYGQCLYDFKISNHHGPCESDWFSSKMLLRKAQSVEWEELIPTLVWRGSDHAFLTHMDEYRKANGHRNGRRMVEHIREDSTQEELVTDLLNKFDELTPRWRGVALTVQEDMELLQDTTGRTRWIDIRFFEKDGNGPYHMEFNQHGVQVKADAIMNSEEMARYKYQIDFGGGGGTTWRGTLTKLAMPGVLFHHETLMKDWFFTDLMIPWKHYIPVDWDLSNLKERYEWAEENPARCKEISQAATELVKYIFSEEYMEDLYQYLYRDHLGRIIDAYQPTELEKTEHGSKVQDYFKNTYENDGFRFYKVFQCIDKKCEETSGSRFSILS